MSTAKTRTSTTSTTTAPDAPDASESVDKVTPLAKNSSVFVDIATVARRSLRSLLREPEFLGPALIIPVFFFIVNVGALEAFVEQGPGIDYRAFQIPVAIIFAVTGISRASVLVIDIQSGYLDRMLVTPVRRTTLLIGMMIADIALALALSMIVFVMGFAAGVRIATGPLGLLALLAFSVAWSLAFTGFPYTVALRTGSPAAVNATFLIFLPFAFLTPAYLPRELMSDWMRVVSAWNPVTYLLEAMRALLTTGWELAEVSKGVAAVGGLGIVTFVMAFRALKYRVATG